MSGAFGLAVALTATMLIAEPCSSSDCLDRRTSRAAANQVTPGSAELLVLVPRFQSAISTLLGPVPRSFRPRELLTARELCRQSLHWARRHYSRNAFDDPYARRHGVPAYSKQLNGRGTRCSVVSSVTARHHQAGVIRGHGDRTGCDRASVKHRSRSTRCPTRSCGRAGVSCFHLGRCTAKGDQVRRRCAASFHRGCGKLSSPPRVPPHAPLPPR